MNKVYKEIDVSSGCSLIGVIDCESLLEFIKEWKVEIVEQYRDEETK